ncbi:unnamed protein product [Anisakis simplex]|uniref:Uncharacterized protein n=1 Tax=Anisakis simplex TaxID=6269 RepID=A0A3P6NMT9_ANISI|nr:unnamed protein product [Anisakis simplex]
MSPEQPVQPLENIVPSVQPETLRPPKPTPSQSPPPPQPPVKHIQPIIPTQSGAEVGAIPSDSDESVQSSAGDVLPAQPEAPRIDPTITAIEQKPKTAPADLDKVKPPEVDFSQDSGVVSVDPTQLSIAKLVPTKTNQATSSSEETEQESVSNKPLFVFTTPQVLLFITFQIKLSFQVAKQCFNEFLFLLRNQSSF